MRDNEFDRIVERANFTDEMVRQMDRPRTWRQVAFDVVMWFTTTYLFGVTLGTFMLSLWGSLDWWITVRLTLTNLVGVMLIQFVSAHLLDPDNNRASRRQRELDALDREEPRDLS